MTSDFWSTPAGRSVHIVTVIAVLLISWEAAVRLFDIKPFLVPAASRVLTELASEPGWYLEHASHTLLESLLGFASAVTVGFVIAVGVISSRLVESTLYTLLVTLNAIPKIALAPLLILWMGTDVEPKVAIALLVALFPIVIDTVLGLRSVEPDMLDLAKSCRASSGQILWKIRFPSALPSIFAGLKVGISLAYIGAIVGEFIAAQRGLGYVIISSQATFDTTRMFAAIVLLALMGTVLFYAVEFVEARLVPWHPSHRARHRSAMAR